MTHKQYSEIQRLLGYISGLIADCNTIVFDEVMFAIEQIDKILENVKVGETK